VYQIFESPVYSRQFILEAAPITDKIEDKTTVVNDKEELDSNTTTNSVTDIKNSTTSSNIKKPKPVVKPNPPEEIQPEEDFNPSDENFDVDPKVTEKENFQAIQKFIIYHKLRELEYKLDNLTTINFYKDKESLMKFTKFLSYVITFFSIFDYKQASKLSERILEEFKKIK